MFQINTWAGIDRNNVRSDGQKGQKCTILAVKLWSGDVSCFQEGELMLSVAFTDE